MPTIAHVEVVPVAGHDSMLLNLSGEPIRHAIVNAGEHLVGEPVARYATLLRDIADEYAGLDLFGRGQQTFDQRITVHAVTALVTALLDLLGQHLGVPVAELLGDGIRRTAVPVLGYLFYVGDHAQTYLPYVVEPHPVDDWERLRRQPALTPDAIVALAEAAQARYGFTDFKLNGGVLAGEEEIAAVRALAAAHEVYRARRLNVRDDAVAMRQLLPGWQFNPKRSCLVRS